MHDCYAITTILGWTIVAVLSLITLVNVLERKDIKSAKR